MSFETLSEDRPFVVKKWGAEEYLVNNELYCSKLLYLKHGFQCSLHYHTRKTETFIAMDGLIGVEFYPEPEKRYETILVGWRHDALHLPAGTAHRFWAFNGDATMLEVSTHHDDEDVIRLEESRERG